MANNDSSRTPTKYLDSKGRRIFLSAKGKAFVNVDGKRQYKPVAKKLTNNAGLNRNLRPNNVKNVPNVMRPKRVPAAPKAKKAAAPKKTNSMKATNMFRKILNKPAARKTRSNKGVSKKSNSVKATNAFRKILNKPAARKTRSNKGVPKKSNSVVATNMFRKILNKPAARKTRSNKGVPKKTAEEKMATKMMAAAKRAAAKANQPRKKRSNAGKPRTMIASPGGTVYKGLASLTRALAKRANAMKNLNKASTVVLRRSTRTKKAPKKLNN